MKTIIVGLAVIATATVIPATNVQADTADVGLRQTIEAPVSKLSFQDRSGNDIAAPRLNFPLRTARYVCQKDATAPSTVLGTDAQKLFASIPDRSASGWDISIAPTNGVENGWHGSSNNVMRISDGTNEGCGEGPDSASKGGLLSVDTSDMQVSDACDWGCADPIFMRRGPSTDYAHTPSVSLYASATPHVGWEGTLSNIRLRQTIPAGQAADDYVLPLTVTLTEL
ncbi:MAG: hypothetical protein JWM37_880 [Candidatus Saccharibacteria bacterium]|nr:hypothetical protein [Candidatus Saccharibacteria bacterium]